MSRWLSKEQQARIEQLVLKAHSQGLTNEKIMWRENIPRKRVEYVLEKYKLLSNKPYSNSLAEHQIDTALQGFNDEDSYISKFP